MKQKYFLVLDAGTSGIKALLFTNNFTCVGRAYKKIDSFSPRKKYIEQDPNQLVEVSICVLKDVVKKTKINPTHISAMGMTNQRETSILWNKDTGKPIYNAIVWEDERTRKYCDGLKNHTSYVRHTTGLTLLPYFSASKIWWILKNITETEKILQENNLLFGTVDTWLLWNLSKEQIHATDYTNASRTLLFDIRTCLWDKKLLNIFSVSKNMLPKAFPSQHIFGMLKKNVLGHEIPIAAICGDQQSSLYGVGIRRGKTKITYGTGTFLMQSIGKKFSLHDDFFTTIIPCENGVSYALEAKIDKSGKSVEEVLTNKKLLYKVLERIAKDAAQEIKKLPITPKKIIADGGITREEFLLNTQQDLVGIPVIKNDIFDGTALGIARLLQDSGW